MFIYMIRRTESGDGTIIIGACQVQVHTDD